ncbi:MAG: hypothetical protein JJT88_00650 [Gammaproteobacteria bacterium]|nr:hypothetical protein [Gammaproteobacteria bacterium]
MWKVMAWVAGVVFGLALAAFALQFVASESGEVVVLETRSGDGMARTRLWVVEDAGSLWLRGGPGSGWHQRVMADPLVAVERQGVRRSYRAHPEPTSSERIHSLMAAKYGWRDQVISWFVGDRSSDVPFRLEPLD